MPERLTPNDDIYPFLCQVAKGAHDYIPDGTLIITGPSEKVKQLYDKIPAEHHISVGCITRLGIQTNYGVIHTCENSRETELKYFIFGSNEESSCLQPTKL